MQARAVGDRFAGRAGLFLRVDDFGASYGRMREAGVPFRDAVHAFSVLVAYAYGFALQETPDEVSRVMEIQRQNVPDMAGYPSLVEAATEMATAGCDHTTEFEFGLDLILDGLERFRAGA